MSRISIPNAREQMDKAERIKATDEQLRLVEQLKAELAQAKAEIERLRQQISSEKVKP